MELLAAVERWAVVAPERVAQESGDRRVTYRELARSAHAVGAFLARELPHDGAPIAFRGHKEPEMIAGFLGSLLAGHPYVPIDTALPALRAEHIAAIADVPLVLTPGEIGQLAERGGTVPPRERRANDVQYVMFTSGSTGEPKGVPITRGNLAAFQNWLLAEQQFAPEVERFLDQVTYSFDVSVMDLYSSLVTGGTLVAVTGEDVADPARLFRRLAQSKISVWVSTPTFAQLCLTEPRFDASLLPDVRRFLFCGETLRPETARLLLGRFPKAAVWNTYGPTETTVAITSVRVDESLLQRYPTLPLGRAAAGSRVLVVDDKLVPLPEGDRGEILIAGPTVSPGYLARVQPAVNPFVTWDGERAYRTGDWGHVEDGLLFFDGRRDSQIKLHGYRIELGDVEAHLAALPDVLAAAVVPVERNGRPEFLTAFVILRDGVSRPDPEMARVLKTALARRLPSYMVPRHVRRVSAFPMTANGKLDRQKLAEQAG